LETAVFRIVQEALTNVFRHSKALKASVSLVIGDSNVYVTIRDNGRGISDHTMKFRPGTIGIGLAGMRQRVKEFGGELQLRDGSPGTLVEVIIPNSDWGQSVSNRFRRLPPLEPPQTEDVACH
jgi:signal transduction histidine kinase